MSVSNNFSQQLYLYVNYDTKTFHLADQNLVLAPPSIVNGECPSAPGRSPETNGLIAVGSVLGALIVVLAVLGILKLWRKKTAAEVSQTAATAEKGVSQVPAEAAVNATHGEELAQAVEDAQDQQDQAATPSSASINRDYDPDFDPLTPVSPLVSPNDKPKQTTVVNYDPKPGKFDDARNL